MAKDFKARMTVRLAVAGAFHTQFMKPAEEKLRSADPSSYTDALHIRSSQRENVLILLSRTKLIFHVAGGANRGVRLGGTMWQGVYLQSCWAMIAPLRLWGMLREALASTDIVEPRIPVVSNVDAKAHSSPEAIRDTLARQV